MIDLSDYDYVVFDCDGVILDSNRLKTEAFVSALDDEPEKYVEPVIRRIFKLRSAEPTHITKTK